MNAGAQKLIFPTVCRIVAERIEQHLDFWEHAGFMVMPGLDGAAGAETQFIEYFGIRGSSGFIGDDN